MASTLALTASVVSGLCAVGGAVGYARKNSVASLVAGSGIAMLYAASAYQLNNKRTAETGRLIGLTSSVLLAAGMGSRAIKSPKPIPVAVATIGAFTAILFFMTPV
jgi:uncharacterized membrane protein (UPF0136 family)